MDLPTALPANPARMDRTAQKTDRTAADRGLALDSMVPRMDRTVPDRESALDPDSSAHTKAPRSRHQARCRLA